LTLSSPVIIRRLATVFATCAALAAFAANSLLCRAALDRSQGAALIDAGSFTFLRLASGALTLLVVANVLALRTSGQRAKLTADWGSAAALFAYAIGFSLAFNSLTAGTGSLILFGSVQATMIAWGLSRGERPRVTEWLGLALAIGGLVYLAWPSVTAPPLVGALLMASAGVAWGIYSLRGRGSQDPIASTTSNFVGSVPLALLAWGLWYSQHGLQIEPRGAMQAIVSGAITSGLGYVIWYKALSGLTATRAATVQLSVPILVMLAAVLLLGESVTLRLALASVIILGGVGLAVLGRKSK
jgi:drug/metabolite transporter (DMT)-like permease